MTLEQMIELLNSSKKEINLNKPKNECDFCNLEITEPPYVVNGKTMCAACFWKWIGEIRTKEVKE